MANSQYKKPDSYSQKAKKSGFKARSVFKLEEIDQKYKVFRSGNRVLDLGAYPGSWSQYVLQKVGKKGLVLGIDIQPIAEKFAPNFVFFHDSILNPELDFSGYAPFDVVLSDMAPSTSGIKDKDVYESLELARMAETMAEKYMKKNGTFVCKVFQGEDFDEFYRELKKKFQKMKSYKPEAVRKTSKEIYIIGWGLKENSNG
jgi:23S rRNA (uridine2552-2'-O)-methyltransferase